MLKELQAALSENRKLQVTVWDPGDETVEYTFPSFVMNSTGSLFNIAPPTVHPTKILPLLQKGAVVGIVVETYPNPYIFYPVVQAVPQSAGAGYWLRIPEDSKIEVIQRRKHVRIPMIIPMEVEYVLGKDKILTLPARTEDVSGGGLRFTAIKLFSKGQDLKFHIQFSPSVPRMQLKARVVFSTQNRIHRQPDDLYVTACQFYDLEDAQEMLIVRECFRRELGLKQ